MDRDPLFTSKFWDAATKNLQMENKISAAYHHNTNGQAERMVQTIKQMLRTVLNKEQDNWRKHLPFIVMALHNRVLSWIDKTPLEIANGYTPQDIRDPRQLEDFSVPAVNEFLASASADYENAKDVLNYH